MFTESFCIIFFINFQQLEQTNPGENIFSDDQSSLFNKNRNLTKKVESLSSDLSLKDEELKQVKAENDQLRYQNSDLCQQVQVLLAECQTLKFGVQPMSPRKDLHFEPRNGHEAITQKLVSFR